MWIVLSILATKLAMMYLNKMVLDCMTIYEKGTVESRINKLLIVRQVLKQNQVPSEQTIRSEQIFLFSTVVMKNFKKVFGGNNKEAVVIENLTYNKEQQNQQFVAYLEEILMEFPKSEFAKLYAAYFYAKKAKLYGNSMRILNELRISSSLKIKYNALLLINYIQTIVKTSYHNAENGSSLDLSLYNYCLSQTCKLKLNMVKQAKLQIGICKESLKATNLARILLDARKISRYRRKIQKLWHHIEGHLVEYYTQPLLLYAQYNLIMNNSVSKYLSYFKNFNSRSLKYNKVFSTDELVQENMFHETTGFMVICGLKKDMGIIKYCSKTIDNIYGEGMVGQNLVMTLPGLMRPYYEDFIQECLNSKDNAHFGKTEFKTCVDKNQFLFQVSNHINISPFLTEGLNFYMLSRKSKETKDYILITNDGDIENYSRPIAEKLGLPLTNASNSKLRISQICPELEIVNNALNSVLNQKKNNDLGSGTTGGDSTPRLGGNKSTRNLNNLVSRFRGFSNSFSSKIGLSLIKDKSKLELARAKAIFQDYTEDGKDITFFPLAKGGVRSTRFQQGGLIYHCKISNFEVQEGRMLILEEIKSMDVDSDDISSRKKEVKFDFEPKEDLEKRKQSIGQFRATKTFFKKIDSDKSDESDSQFTTEEEKEGGWVDFNMLVSPVAGSERPLNLLGISEDALFASTERNLIGSPREGLTIRHSIATKRRPNVLGIVLKAEEERGDQAGTGTATEVDVVKENESSVASKSKFDMQEKISKTFEQAVGTKYYSNIYKCLLVLVYSIFLGLVVSMIILSQTLNSDIGFLKGRKDLMISMEMENVLIIGVQRNIHILTGYISGEQDENDYDLEFRKAGLLDSLSLDLSEMSEYNQHFLKNMEILDDENREKLFVKDVKIFYNGFGDSTETLSLFTIIGAIQKMLELGSKAVGLAKGTLSDALPDFNIILRNSLNDFLVKNQERVDTILDSSDTNKDKVFSSVDKTWIGTLVGMACLAVAYAGMIAKQYQREKQNLIAFTKLNPKRVRNLESKLTTFMTAIENEEELKSIQNLQYIETEHAKIKNQRIESLNSQGGKGGDRGLILKYALYAVHFLIALVIVMVFVTVNSIETRNSINNLNSKLLRLMFVERSMSRINLAMTTPVELIAGNDMTLVENKIPSVELANLIEELNTIQNSFLEYFDQSSSESESVIVNEILFEDACAPFEKIVELNQACELLKKGLSTGYSSGFVQFIDYLREVLKNAQSEYQASDKSSASLASLQKEYINDEMAPFLILRPINDILVGALDWQFEDQIVKSQRKNNLLNALLYTFIVIICIALYFCLLRKIGESDNEFKEVLRVFPSGLIFSNFILKSYLRKTSPGVLNHIINKI